MYRERHLRPLIVLDPGHGGKDPGAVCMDVYEKERVLVLAHLVAELLDEKGVEVQLTRSTDDFLTLAERATMANAHWQEDTRHNSAFFVSLHCNAAENKAAHGAEVFYYPGETQYEDRARRSEFLATNMLQEIVHKTGARNRGVKPAGYYVLRESLLPAVLVECGFITNDEERSNLADDEYLLQVAGGVVAGIVK